MSKYKLSYSKLNSEIDIEELSFTSPNKRNNFITDKIIGTQTKRVFVIGIEHSDNNTNLFIFDLIIDPYIFKNILNNKWEKMFLFEFESYEEAYDFSLDMKEVSPLCYNND